MDISQFFMAPDIMNLKRVLCVQPHPDDNEIGMGGIIAKLSENGCEVHYLTITSGDLGMTEANYTQEELAKLRHEEAIAAGEKLGVAEFHFMNYPDGSLENIPKLAGEISELIRLIRPEGIFCPDPWAPYEAHNDHIVTGKAAAMAFISSGLLEYPRGTKTAPWQMNAIGFYFTSQQNTVIDITNTFERKFEAMSEHKTQLSEQQLNLYRYYFHMRGQKLAADLDFEIGEGLKVLRPEHMHCFAEAQEI
ncbi:MAG: PIG-L family deacetylase [Clostridiales bacterium]|nr:PIG-L family deacetylase [Clostridiales bacterium]